MLKIHFITSGKIDITLEGLDIDFHLRDPIYNVKNYSVNDNKISLNSDDMRFFTDWGCLSLRELNKKEKIIKVCVDSEKWGWYATAQIMIEKDGQIILNDNFQSGVRGPVGDPRKVKSFVVK